MSSSESEAQTMASLAGSRDIPRVLRLVSELCKTLSSQLTDGKARLVHPSQVRLVTSASGDESVGEFSAITLVGPEAAKDPSVDLVAAYVAPEVFAGKPEAVASTVYHVAAVAYHLLTGQPPFAGSSPAAIRIKVLLERPENPRSIRPELSAELAQVLLQALDKQPATRPRSLDDLVAKLLDAAQHAVPAASSAAQTDSAARSVPGSPMRALAFAEGSPSPASSAQARKSKSAVAALLVAVVLLLASGSLLLLRSSPEHAPHASAPAAVQPGAPPPALEASQPIGKASEEAMALADKKTQPAPEAEKTTAPIKRKSKSKSTTRAPARPRAEAESVQQGEAPPSRAGETDPFAIESPPPEAPRAPSAPGAAGPPRPMVAEHKQVPAEAKQQKKAPAKTTHSTAPVGKKQRVRGPAPDSRDDDGPVKLTEQSKQKSGRVELPAEPAQAESKQERLMVPSPGSGGGVITEAAQQPLAPQADRKKLVLGIVLLVIALVAAVGACLLLWVIRRDRQLVLQNSKTQRAGSEADTFPTTKAEEAKSSKGAIDPFTVGQYTCYARLGEGGMGMVYKARHTELGREAAVKVLSPSAMVAPDAIELFQREAKLSSQINHPNSVFIYDHGNVSGALFYLVMEFIDGQSLDEIISPKGKAPRPLPIARVLTLTRQICSVLDTAHSQGIVHRGH